MRATAEFRDDGSLVISKEGEPFLTMQEEIARSLYELLRERYNPTCPCSNGWEWSNSHGRWCIR